MTLSLEQFFSAHGQSLPAAVPSSSNARQRSVLAADVRLAAKHGLRIFPVSPKAKRMATPNMLINEATCDIGRLEELADEHGPCREWLAVADPWLCILRIAGTTGGNSSVSTLSLDSQEDCHTLMARRGDITWAFFKVPRGFARRSAARHLATGLTIISAGHSCPIPLLSRRVALYHSAEIEIAYVPFWLRERAFEAAECPPR